MACPPANPHSGGKAYRCQKRNAGDIRNLLPSSSGFVMRPMTGEATFVFGAPNSGELKRLTDSERHARFVSGTTHQPRDWLVLTLAISPFRTVRRQEVSPAGRRPVSGSGTANREPPRERATPGGPLRPS